MDNMREEFEVWCCGRGFTLRPAETDCGVLIDGEYWHPIVQLAWESWKASRAALCVELPCSLGYPNNDMVYLSDVEERLEKAGVSYK